MLIYYMKDKSIITIKEASVLLSVHPNTLRKWDNIGLLKAVRIGTRKDRRFFKDDVLRLIKKSTYVANEDEVSKVAIVRRSYFENYASFLIDKAHLTTKSVIVDVPSGTGGMSKALKERGYGSTFHQIDINEEMIEAAKLHFDNNQNTFTIGDAADIQQLVPEKVDAIFCLNGFHLYIDKKEKFLKGCKEILKEDGVLIFDVSTRGLRDEGSKKFLKLQLEEITRLASEIGATANFPMYPDDNTFALYRKYIKRADLKLIETVTFEKQEPVTDYVQSTLDIRGRLRPWLPNISDEERLRIYKEGSEMASTKCGAKEISHSRMFFVVKR